MKHLGPALAFLLPFFSVSRHDPENTFDCSFIEPPSATEHQTPSWSSQESFSSFETSEDGPVYCVPHEGELWSKQLPVWLTGSSNLGVEESLNNFCAKPG